MLIFMWVSTTFWPTGLLKNFTLVYLICLLIMSTDSSVQTCMLSFFILSGEICPFSQSHKNFHQISYHVFCLIVFCDGKNIHKGLSMGGCNWSGRTGPHDERIEGALLPNSHWAPWSNRQKGLLTRTRPRIS